MELRKDPITRSWVVVGHPERQKPRADACPLCPGNRIETRSLLELPRQGPWQVRAYPHFRPLYHVEGDPARTAEGIYDRMAPIGAHEIIVETPDHTRSLPFLADEEIERVLEAYALRTADLKRDARFKYVTLFKNQGVQSGEEWTHSHSQLTATTFVPRRILYELRSGREWFRERERCVFCDIIAQELENGSRVVAENENFLTIAPYAPRFPFETWILPKQHESAFENSSSHMFENLAKALKTLLIKADRVLDNPPYNLVVHTSPAQDPTNDHYHWHIEFMPKLTKTAGFEWGTGFYINPTPPEEAAKFLREASVEEPVPTTVG